MIDAPVAFPTSRYYYGLTKQPQYIYFDNLISGRDTDYSWASTGPSVGLLKDRLWSRTPIIASTGEPLTISLSDPSNPSIILENYSLTLITTDPIAKALNFGGRTLYVHPIGDSLFAAAGNSLQLQQSSVLVGGGPKFQTIGSRQTSFNSNGVIVPPGTIGATVVTHEGRGGWTIDDYGKIPSSLFRKFWKLVCPTLPIPFVANDEGYRYTVNHNGGTGIVHDRLIQNDGSYILLIEPSPTNLQFNPALPLVPQNGDPLIVFTSGVAVNANPLVKYNNNQFDYANYLNLYNLPSPDAVIIGVAANNIAHILTDSQFDGSTSGWFSKYDNIISTIRSWSANVPIFVCPARCPPSSQNVFTSLEAGQYFNQKLYKYFVMRFNVAFLTYYDTDDHVANKVYILPSYLGMDMTILPVIGSSIHPPYPVQVMEGNVWYSTLTNILQS